MSVEVDFNEHTTVGPLAINGIHKTNYTFGSIAPNHWYRLAIALEPGNSPGVKLQIIEETVEVAADGAHMATITVKNIGNAPAVYRTVLIAAPSMF
jgi:hypothetical protein